MQQPFESFTPTSQSPFLASAPTEISYDEMCEHIRQIVSDDSFEQEAKRMKQSLGNLNEEINEIQSHLQDVSERWNLCYQSTT